MCVCVYVYVYVKKKPISRVYSKNNYIYICKRDLHHIKKGPVSRKGCGSEISKEKRKEVATYIICKRDLYHI